MASRMSPDTRKSSERARGGVEWEEQGESVREEGEEGENEDLASMTVRSTHHREARVEINNFTGHELGTRREKRYNGDKHQQAAG